MDEYDWADQERLARQDVEEIERNMNELSLVINQNPGSIDINFDALEEQLGDVKAYQAIMKTVGQTERSEADLEEQRIRTDRAKRARDQEVGDTDDQDENIRDFLKAMRPTQEDLDNLFADEVEEEEDAEGTEEASEV